MAKRKKSRRKKSRDFGPKHVLPVGFWAQVTAIFLIAISILFVVAWFNAGGPVLNWVYNSSLAVIGYAVYIIPALFIYIAIEIFRAEDNRLPYIMRFASFVEVLWVSSLLGIPASQTSVSTGGGIVGELINKGVLQLVNTNVAIFIYILLILLTLLFMSRSNPKDVVMSLWGLVHRETEEEDENGDIMRKVSNIDRGFKVSGIVDEADETEISKGGLTILRNRRPKPTSSPVSTGFDDGSKKSETALMTVTDPNWVAPSLDLLESKEAMPEPGDIKQNASIIKETMAEFDIDVEMEGANVGPRATQYRLRPASGVKLSRITALETNLALNLAAKSLRMEAPIPGEKVVGIEVPNVKAADVRIKAIFSSKQWKDSVEPLTFAIGKDISGEKVIGELNKMPHLLIAGTTGSGKSVMINSLLVSLLYRNSPSDLKLILIDPKRVEMTQYEDIPHLLAPVIVEVEKAISSLKWSVNEMERRYKTLHESRVKDIKEYNIKIKSTNAKVPIEEDDGTVQEHENGAMPYIVIVIDELADLMMTVGRDLEALIAKIAQKGRAAGIHLVLATQTPRADIITGLIKANISSRIAFTVTQNLESRIILDQGGAEKLLGAGDMLFMTASSPKPKRIQGAWVTNKEIDKVVAHLQSQSLPDYNDDVTNQRVQLNGKGGVVPDHEGSNGGADQLFDEAVQMVINTQKASASSLQRRFRIGYSRAANIIDSMEEQGIVGPADRQRPREVLISSLDDLNGPDDVDQSDDL